MTSLLLTLGSTRLLISGEGMEIEFLQSASAVAPRGCSPVTTPGADESVVRIQSQGPACQSADAHDQTDFAARSGDESAAPIPSASSPALTEPADVRLLPASAGNLSRNDSYIGLHRVRA